MKNYRLLFFLWLAGGLLLWLFSDNNCGIYLVAASLVCETLEIGLALGAGRHLSVQLTCPATASQKVETPLTVAIQNTGSGSRKVAVSLCCRNLLTGAEWGQTVYATVGRRSTVSVEVPLREELCGKCRITATKISTCDAFGLIFFSRPADSQTALLILPTIYPVELSVGEQRQTDLCSEEYSMLRSGDDPSETFALREYRPGDKIKNIHWKLSEKIGEPTVRELGLPVNNSVLLLLDNSVTEGLPEREQLAHLGELAVSVSAALTSLTFAHDVAWLDRERNEIAVFPVTGEEDMTAVMSGMLSAGTAVEEQTVWERFVTEHTLSEFAHILVFTHHPGQAEETLDNTQVVFLSPSCTDKEGLYVEI